MPTTIISLQYFEFNYIITSITEIYNFIFFLLLDNFYFSLKIPFNISQKLVYR